jgi:triosephosphate isomerase
MNMTHTDAIALVRTISYELKEQDYDRVDVVVCPPYTSLRSVQLVTPARSPGCSSRRCIART